MLHAVEVALRNNLDRTIGPAFPVARYKQVPSWIDRIPRVIIHEGREDAIARAKAKLLGWNRATHDHRHGSRIQHGDLVAAMSFGFWIGLLDPAYDAPGIAGTYFWPNHVKMVFPGATGRRRQRISTTSSLRRFVGSEANNRRWPRKFMALRMCLMLMRRYHKCKRG